MRTTFTKLLKQLRKNFPDSNLDDVRKAYRIANEAHMDQARLSGEPYVMHSIQVGHILARLGLDPVICAAGLLHDVLEDTPVTRAELKREFGEEIVSLIEGVTKISGLSFPEEQVTLEVKQAQNIRKMLVATARDVRVILIKLADRLHNMRTIEFLPREKQMRISRETLDIYAPLAHRLGISRWKWELEDHAFRCLMPDEYREMARQVAMQRRERETYLNDTIHFLEDRLTEAEVNARVIGRPKHLYSIYQKMVQQGKDFGEVMDIHGLRIICRTETGCYNALGVVHSLWPPVPGRMKDYIAMPKINGYQAIHTTVMRENGHPMEVQIRSENMDQTAQEGIAAHWVYKEGSSDRRLEEQLDWLRQMYEWLKDASSAEELMDSMRLDFKDYHIYVFTPKGAVKELPAGATPLDFAYRIHSDIGHQCIGARVNGRMVPLRYHLQTGDVVEILTSRAQTPHLDWLDVVVTGKARTRIRQKLREIGELGVPPGQQGESQEEKPPQPARHRQEPPKKIRDVDAATRQKLIRIEGARGLQVQFAKCCNPMPGHAILGYITRSTGITVHRADCRGLSKSKRDPDRIVEAFWEGEGLYETTMRVVTGPRPNVLADITNALRPLNLDITRAIYEPGEDGKSNFDFVFQTADEKTVAIAERSLRNVSGVSLVTRMGERARSAHNFAQAG
jgi:GTP diphosphokinase / guanosine-3',5'-bis(diphosphate) 3'-diphosphatase